MDRTVYLGCYTCTVVVLLSPGLSFPMWLLLVVIRARSQCSGCTATIRLIVHLVF
jgi:hypothetical protein